MNSYTSRLAFIAALTLAGSAQAASLSAGFDIKTAAPTSLVEDVSYRRCWYDDGDRYCRTYYHADDSYYDGGGYGYYGSFPIIGFGGGYGGRGGYGGYGGGHRGGYGGGHGRR